MKKLIALLVVSVLAVACMPKLPVLPEVPTLDSVQLPVVAQENTLWSSDDYNDKPVLIVFMGSWCPWCKKTMPAVNALSEKYQGQVEIVGAFMDEVPVVVKDVAAEHGLHAQEWCFS